MRIIKNTKGITLISLVITIIIIIILASVATYSGIKVVNSSKLAAFTTELKIMQTQVNKLYDERTDDEETIDGLGKEISTVQTQADKVFAAIANEIDNRAGYRYYDQETIKNLGIEGVEGEFFVNVQKRSVVSYEGLKYEGNTYYTLNQLPDSLYNVEYQASQEQPDFDVDYDYLENGRYKITISNINYNGNINNWQVKYKKEEEQDWKTTNNYSFIIDELGNYRVKIANNNTESREKQIKAKSSLLPSEFQEVEYIESTGTQYINTRVIPDNTTGLYIKHSICNNNNKDNIIIGTRANNNNSRFWIDIDWGRTDTLGWGFNKYSQEGRRFSLTSKEGQTIETTLNYKNERKGKVNNNEVDNFDDRGTLVNQSYPITIFCGNNQGNYGYFTKSKVYNVVISEGNNIIRNFIPCYTTIAVTDIDGINRQKDTIGLYDTVNGQFYVNQGSDTFRKGNDIDSGETINTIIINDL